MTELHKLLPHEIRVKYLQMELGIHEQIVDNKDGTYTLFLNPIYNYESQKDAYDHGVSHAADDDFGRPDVQEIERTAHGENS